MARYLTVHVIACVTRQNLKRLADRLREDSEVRLVRLVADTLEGAMIGEFESPSGDVLRAYLARQQVQAERILRAELEFP
ncbi:MAG: hypothetical protein HYU36_07720 [Planctomycetes bacterium]|nr:hypothetical protein [Planctomycetota bacterium]